MATAIAGIAMTLGITTEHQRGIEVGRRWAGHATSHELATIVSGSFDDLSRLLPKDLSDQFVGGFREGVLHFWRGA